MRDQAKLVTDNHWTKCGLSAPPGNELLIVANNFQTLQAARHLADYDTTRRHGFMDARQAYDLASEFHSAINSLEAAADEELACLVSSMILRAPRSD
jgi:hypothetical protein